MLAGGADGMPPARRVLLRAPAGGASLHLCMTPHGPDTSTYEAAVAPGAEAPAHLPRETLAFMFETSLTPRVTPAALGSPCIDRDYYKCWCVWALRAVRRMAPAAAAAARSTACVCSRSTACGSIMQAAASWPSCMPCMRTHCVRGPYKPVWCCHRRRRVGLKSRFDRNWWAKQHGHDGDADGLAQQQQPTKQQQPQRALAAADAGGALVAS